MADDVHGDHRVSVRTKGACGRNMGQESIGVQLLLGGCCESAAKTMGLPRLGWAGAAGVVRKANIAGALSLARSSRRHQTCPPMLILVRHPP